MKRAGVLLLLPMSLLVSPLVGCEDDPAAATSGVDAAASASPDAAAQGLPTFFDAASYGPTEGGSPGAGGDGAVVGATLMGTITLPGNAAGKELRIRLMSTPTGVPVAEVTGAAPAGDKILFNINGVAAGSYYLLAFVDLDGSGGSTPTKGDYTGFYGHTGDGNAPGAANVVVGSSGTVTLDWTLVVK